MHNISTYNVLWRILSFHMITTDGNQIGR